MEFWVKELWIHSARTSDFNITETVKRWWFLERNNHALFSLVSIMHVYVNVFNGCWMNVWRDNYIELNSPQLEDNNHAKYEVH